LRGREPTLDLLASARRQRRAGSKPACGTARDAL